MSNWASTLVLDRGSQHGVAIGDCAVDSAGNLVGVVTDVGLNWCRLSTVLDTDSQFGARVFRTGETAVAGGDLALMAEGRLRLQYLSDSANLIKGDVIVTSGLGGYYPAGLVIGTVESVQTDDGGLARYAVLSPKCDVAAIQEMFIITDFDVIPMTEDGYDTAGDTAEVDIVLSVRAGAGTAAGAGAGIRAGMGRTPVPAAGHRGDTGHAGAQRAGAAVRGIFRAGVRPSLAGGGPAVLLRAGVPAWRGGSVAAERAGHHGGRGVLAGGDRRMYAALRTAAHGGAGGITAAQG